MSKRICWETKLAGFSIILEQRGLDRFVVRYGQQEDKGDYETASHRLGEAIMHALACEGRVDNALNQRRKKYPTD